VTSERQPPPVSSSSQNWSQKYTSQQNRHSLPRHFFQVSTSLEVKKKEQQNKASQRSQTSDTLVNAAEAELIQRSNIVITTPPKLLVCLGRGDIFNLCMRGARTFLSHSFPPHPIHWSPHSHWNIQRLTEPRVRDRSQVNHGISLVIWCSSIPQFLNS
jgi:hypothetical protein